MTLNIPNLDRLISHLEGLPPDEFNMKHLYKRDHSCGTACCIAGHAKLVFHLQGFDHALDVFGVSERNWIQICQPKWYDREEAVVARDYPLSRAIRTLKHMRSEYLRTGQVVVDWDAPEPEAKPAWTAPKAIKQTKPALPAEIVRFLRPADLEVVS